MLDTEYPKWITAYNCKIGHHEWCHYPNTGDYRCKCDCHTKEKPMLSKKIPTHCTDEDCDGTPLPPMYDYVEEIDEEDERRRYRVAIGVVKCPKCGTQYEEVLGRS